MSKSKFGRFNDGVQISGVSMSLHQKGKVFYVCNSTTAAPLGIAGSDGNKGNSPEHPLATLAQAVKLVKAGRGDKIVVLPGHAETVSSATALTFSAAGVDVIGVGTGNQRPTLTLDTATTSTVNVTAADVSIQNIIFVANFAAVASAITTTAKDTQVLDCDFRDTSSILNFVNAVTTSTTSNANDGLVVQGNNFNGVGTTSATSLVNVTGTADRVSIRDNVVNSKANVAAILAIIATGKILTNASVVSNRCQSAYTGSAGCLMTTNGSTNTGLVTNNLISITGGGTDLLVTASSGFGFHLNYIGDASGSGVLKP